MSKNKRKIEVDSMDESLELYELDNGIVRVDTNIDEYMYSDLDRRIQYLLDNGHKNITFKITSPGGDAYGAMAIYDLIMGLNNRGIKTTGLVEGIAASAASMVVLQAVQNRYSKPNARFLIHEPRRWALFRMEKTSDMRDETKEMMAITGMIYEIVASRCKKSVKEITKTVDRTEVWMSSKEALEFGLIDKIVN